MTVKPQKLNSNFVRWNKTQLKSSSSSVVDVGKKVNLMSSIPAVKATTRPTYTGSNFVALSFLVNGQYFKDYHKILGTVGLDQAESRQWIHIVAWTVPFVKRIANWSVQKARTEAVRRLLSDSRPQQLRRYLPRCEDRQKLVVSIFDWQKLRSFHWNWTYTGVFVKLCLLIVCIIGT